MLLKVEHLRKEFSPEAVPLRDLCCDVEKGDVISIIGPSGTGKSTFLQLLNRLLSPTSGKIYFCGEDTTAPGYNLPALRRRMGMVFQSFNLFSHLTLAENVMLGQVKLLGRSRQEAYDTALSLLSRVGLIDKASSYPSELSGGQQQRAAIARAMAMEPEVLLFDEPTSALDPTMVWEVLSVIRSLAKEGVTMLIVTHEMSFAREVSSRVFYLDEGILYEEGSPSQFFDHPQREKTRLFVKNIKAFHWDMAEKGRDYLSLNSDLEAFAYRNMMPPEILRSLTLLVEEIYQQLTSQESSASPDLSVSVEYSDKKQEATLVASWKDFGFNPLKEGDELSKALISFASPDAAFFQEGDRSLIRATVMERR